MTPAAERDDQYAAYGLRLTGLGPAPGQRPRPPADWPLWHVEQHVGARVDDSPGMSVEARGARIGMPGTGEIIVDRAASTITFATFEAMEPEAILHPALVPAAAVISWWAGRSEVHASAVLIDGSAWGLMADREGGKSTTAALVAARGHDLFADDMLIVERQRCFAGPGIVDLRQEAARALGGRALGVVGTRARWRKPLRASALEAPLGGWVDLGWSTDDHIRIEELEPAARIAALGRQMTLPADGPHLLEMADVPMLRFTRPHGLHAADLGVGALLSAIEARSSG